MSLDCGRCGTPTDSDSIVINGRTLRLCDGCRHQFNQWLADWVEGDR